MPEEVPKRYVSGRDRRSQFIDRRPISVRSSNVEKRYQAGLWEGNMLIGKGRKQAIVSLVECMSGYAGLKKVTTKTSELVNSAIVKGLRPIAYKVKTITLLEVWSSHSTRR